MAEHEITSRITHPLVIDHRTDPPTPHGRQGDTVYLIGDEAWVVSARVPLSESTVVPADRPVRDSIRILPDRDRKVGFIKKALQMLMTKVRPS